MFKNPIAPKIKEKKEKGPWSYKCPEYDERSSCYIQAGTSYGVGRKNPVGHANNPKVRVPTMPFGHPSTMKSDSTSVAHEMQDYLD